MKSRQKKASEVKPPIEFPKELQITHYAGYEDWSNQHWAWEFLRRGITFQERCDEVQNWPNSRLTRMNKMYIAKAFGLKKYKYYKEDYASGDTPNPRFTSEFVSYWSRIDEDAYADQVLPTSLNFGEALIRFDILAMEKSKKSLSAQLNSAKERLQQGLEQYLNQKKTKSGDFKNKIPLIELLRTFDAFKYKATPQGAKLTNLAIANEILPQSPNPPLDPEGDIQSRRKRAMEYVVLIYQDLAATKKR